MWGVVKNGYTHCIIVPVPTKFRYLVDLGTVILMMVPQNSHATCPNCQKNFGHMSIQMSGSMPQLWCVCRLQICILVILVNLFILMIFGHFFHFDFGHKSTQKPWPMPQLWYFTLATSPHICGTIIKMTARLCQLVNSGVHGKIAYTVCIRVRFVYMVFIRVHGL